MWKLSRSQATAKSEQSDERRPIWQVFYECFVACWAAGNFFLVGREFIKDHLLLNVANGVIRINDFVLFYEAGKLAASANHLQVYDPNVQRAWMQAFTAPAVCEQVLFIYQVPPVFPLMIPLGFLPIKLAYLLWVALGLSCALAACIYILKSVRKCSRRFIIVSLLAVLSTLPSLMAIELGQIAWFLVALMSGFLIFTWLIPNYVLAGLMLALFAIKPHYAIFFVAPLVATKKWLVLLWAAVWEALLLVLAGFVIGWQNVLGYPSMILKMETVMGASNQSAGSPAHMVCLRGLYSVLLGPAVATKLSLITTLLALVLSAVVSWRLLALPKQQDDAAEKEQSKQRLWWTLTISSMLCLIASAHTFLYDWLIILPSVLLTIRAVKLKELRAVMPLSNRVWTGAWLIYPCFSAIVFLCWEYVAGMREVAFPITAMHIFLLGCALKCGFDSLKTEPLAEPPAG
jgi:hypothetical protein